MSWRDFREFIGNLETKGGVRKIEGADLDLEIGTMTEIACEKKAPMLLFDKIKGYPAGYRIAAKPYSTIERSAMALGMTLKGSNMEMFRDWRERMKEYSPIKPLLVKDGPVMENVRTGNQVNLLEFPTPKWHEHDGGPYIGTGCVVITKDPETGWVNYGTYRAQIHDEKTTGIDAAPHHHAKLMMRKYWAKGESCPIAIAISVDPALFCASTSDLPWGRPEIELAGFVKGSPIEIVESELTGLPLPATAELIYEGEVPPMEVEQRKEGPFGEYTGYYAGGEKMAPVIRVKAVYFRTNPILHGEPPLKPPIDTWVIPPAVGINFLWDGLERGGLPGIRGVYALRVGGRFITVVSIKQQYGGHARLVGKMASALIQGMGRFIIVVDEDIDPSDPEDILWAMASRCDPETQIEIERNCPSSTLDAMVSPEKRAKGDLTNSRAVIIACKPFDWMDKFPRVNKASEALRDKIMQKWGDALK